MAADNDDAYNLTPAFILETVEVAREFVLGIPEGSKGDVTRTSPTQGPALAPKIASFLAWPQERVKYALAQLAAFEPDNRLTEGSNSVARFTLSNSAAAPRRCARANDSASFQTETASAVQPNAEKVD